MKRIRMITFHSPKNYGAVLQAYSLMSFLKTKSDDVQIIDFNTPHLQSLYPLYAEFHSVKGFVKFLLDVIYVPKKRIKYMKFDEFVNNNMTLTQRYGSLDELKKKPPVADYYCTGSDQVFNPNRVEDEKEAFYLNFGAKEIKRISYAGSFGIKTVPDEKKEEISKYLSGFYKISVREKSGVNIIADLISKEAVEVLDPVFLNTKESWRELEKDYPVGTDSYLLYYRLMSNPKSDETVRRIAEEKKLKLVVISDGFIKWKAYRILRDVGPLEFLYLFDHAAYVATDSFHGVAFSLIYEKQFIFVDYNEKLAERALNLMEKAGVGYCAGLNNNQGDAIIDYTIVKSNMSRLIEVSKKFLTDALQ